jgi:protocatechuate 3,4-dioxygenase beta subunit
MESSAEFFFRPAAGEYIETAVHIAPETRSAIFGTVLDASGTPVADALVILGQSGTDGICARQFTDSTGRFCFGPLEDGVLYRIQVFKNDVRVRELEIKAE